MRSIKTLFVLLATSSLLFSCNDKDAITPSQVLDGDALSVEDIVLSPSGSAHYITFTTANSWTIEGSIPEWLTIDQKKGKPGIANIKISAPINDTKQDRETYITFNVGKGQDNPGIHISQDFPYMNAKDLDLSFAWHESVEGQATPVNLSIESNVKWKFVHVDGTAESKYTISVPQGSGDQNVSFLPKVNNLDKTHYSASWNLIPYREDEDGNYEDISSVVGKYQIKMDQANFRFLINDSADDFTININQFNDKIDDISVDCETEWSVLSMPTWLKSNVSNGEKGISGFNVGADGIAPMTQDREGEISLKAPCGAVRTIKVKQDGYVFAVGAEGFDFSKGLNLENNDLSEYSITLTTAGPWEIKNIPDWMTVSPSSSDAISSTPLEYQIKVKAKEQNLRFADDNPSGAIIITRKLKPAGYQEDPLDKNMTVQQAPFIFDIVPSASLSNIPTLSTDFYNVKISCSGEWYVKDGYPDWLSFSVGDNSLNIGAKTANPDVNSDRTGVVTVVSKAHENKGLNIYRTFDVRQQKFIFNDSEVVLDFPCMSGGSKNINVECSGPWKITGNGKANFSTLQGNGNSTVTVSLPDNYTTSDITSEYILTSEVNGLQRMITINQSKFIFNSDPVVLDFDYAAGQKDISIVCSGGWSVENEATWVKVSKSSGNGNMAGTPETISVSVDANTIEESRSVVLKIVSSDNKSLIKYITINQAKAEPAPEE